MDVIVEGNEVSVLYIKTHVGHDLEPKRLTLTKNEKDFLAEQLVISNTNYNDILNAVKTLDCTSRLYHLTRRDLVTIKSSLMESAKKNNIMETSENNKPNDTTELNNVFDSDLISLCNVQYHEKSTHNLNAENSDADTKSEKQDCVVVSNAILSADHINIKDDYVNKVGPIYELNVDQQIVEQNEQIPIIEFNQEVSTFNIIIIIE